MSLINLRERTINAKIVYYGTALSGKTTSLKHVHRVIDPDDRVELVSLNTDGDRTLFFDFLPIALGTLSGFQVKLQAYTVPGQVKYNLTRRYVLRGADAVVFVADSRPETFEDNLAAMRNMRENLEANGLDPDRIPLLIQYNKRDYPSALPVMDLRAALNRRGVPDVETVATVGDGVFEGFAMLCCDMVENLAREYRIGDGDSVREVLEERLAGIADRYQRPVEPPPALRESRIAMLPSAARAPRPSGVIHVPGEPTGFGMRPDETQLADVEEMLEQAVETQMKSAQLVAELNETRQELADHVRQLSALHQTAIAISSELDPGRLLDRVLRSALDAVGAQHGSVLLPRAGSDELEAELVHGFRLDPLAGGSQTDPSLVHRVLQGRPFLVGRGADAHLLHSTDASGFTPRMGLVAPLVHQREILGALVVYLDRAPAEPELDARLNFLGAIATQAAVALENARLYDRIESFNRELEQRVAERTAELERAYEELRVLDAMKDDFLASMSHELMTPLTSIRGSAEILVQLAEDDSEHAASDRAEFAGIVDKESGRLADMLQALLDLSQLEADEIRLERDVLDIRALLVEAYKRRRAAFRAAGIQVRVRAAPDLPPAVGDARWLAKVFDELLSNALKFAPEGSTVQVLLHAIDDDVIVTVQDEGPGVPDSVVGQVFERFKQAGEVLTDKTPGLGLGLPLSARILELHGGEIWVECPPGGGSRFSFRVPSAAGTSLAR